MLTFLSLRSQCFCWVPLSRFWHAEGGVHASFSMSPLCQSVALDPGLLAQMVLKETDVMRFVCRSRLRTA